MENSSNKKCLEISRSDFNLLINTVINRFEKFKIKVSKSLPYCPIQKDPDFMEQSFKVKNAQIIDNLCLIMHATDNILIK